MALLFLAGTLLLGLAGALVVRALMLARMRVATQIDKIDAYGFDPDAETQPRPTPLARALARMATNAERIGRSTRGRGWRAPPTTQQLRAAGLYTMSSDAF